MFYNDTGLFPATIKDLFINPFPSSNPLSEFNRDTNLGWRGPYIISQGGTYPRTDSYGTVGDPAILDAWGNPIVLQIPTSGATPAANLQFMRLISAGPNKTIDTPQNAVDLNGNPYPTTDRRGDDILLFTNHSDSDP